MAAGKTYEPISTTTVSGTPTSITLSPPSTYTDLKLIVWHGTGFADNMNIRFNSDTASNYYFQYFNGGTQAQTNTSYIELNWGDGVNSFYNVDIFNYNGAAWKGLQARQADYQNYPGANVGTWRGTAAITSITLRIGAAGSSTFPNGTIVTLFGISAA